MNLEVNSEEIRNKSEEARKQEPNKSEENDNIQSKKERSKLLCFLRMLRKIGWRCLAAVRVPPRIGISYDLPAISSGNTENCIHPAGNLCGFGWDVELWRLNSLSGENQSAPWVPTLSVSRPGDPR